MQTTSFTPDTLFSQVFHASPLAMTITDLADACYVDVNAAYAAMLGGCRSEYVGRPNLDLLLSGFANGSAGGHFAARQPATANRIHQLQARDGDVRHVIASSQIEECAGRAYVLTFFQDLTDFRRAQDALYASESRFRLLFDSMPLPVFVYDADTLRIIDVNTTAVSFYGYGREELLAMTMLDLRPPETRPAFLEAIALLPDDTRHLGTWKQQKKDGTLIDVEVTSFALELDGQRMRLNVLQDVTESLAMQEALRGSEERLRIIADVTTDLIWELDFDTQTVAVTQEIRSLFGYELDESISLDWWIGKIHPEDRPATLESFARAVEGTAQTWSAQYRFRRADGRYTHVMDRGYILRDEAKQAQRMIGAMVNISHQVEVKEAAARAADEERRRLARDLHDAVTQSLYSLSLMAEAARRRTRLGDTQAASDYVARLGELAQQSLKEMRLLVYELRPQALEKEGLTGALQARLDAVERRAGVHARLQVEVAEELPQDVQVQFFRVAEEALNNALKHAGASAVRVRVRSNACSAALEITDNGKGFDPDEAVSAGGLGLISMRERLENLGGNIEVDTAPGKGTTIRVTLNKPDGNHGQQDTHPDL